MAGPPPQPLWSLGFSYVWIRVAMPICPLDCRSSVHLFLSDVACTLSIWMLVSGSTSMAQCHISIDNTRLAAVLLPESIKLSRFGKLHVKVLHSCACRCIHKVSMRVIYDICFRSRPTCNTFLLRFTNSRTRKYSLNTQGFENVQRRTETHSRLTSASARHVKTVAARSRLRDQGLQTRQPGVLQVRQAGRPRTP